MNTTEISLEQYQNMTLEEKKDFYSKIKEDNLFEPAIRLRKTANMKIIGFKQPHGRLTFIEELRRIDKKVTNLYYLCICDCGNWYILTNRHFDQENMISCGCYRKERGAEMCKNIIGPNNALDLIGQIFGDLQVIEKTNKRIDEKVIWKCKCIHCGHEQEAQATMLVRNIRMFCDTCSQKKSKGEKIIGALLQSANINFIKEKIFDECRFQDTNKPAYFDFYVNNEYIIEFDGEQHFVISRFNNISVEQALQNLIKVKEHDKYKTQWCKDNNIPLIRIPYTHLNDLCLNDLLLETTSFLVE